jgi:hypothetical protein
MRARERILVLIHKHIGRLDHNPKLRRSLSLSLICFRKAKRESERKRERKKAMIQTRERVGMHAARV